MSNRCRIRFLCDCRTGHLGIVEFRMAAGGIPAESRVSAEGPQNPRNRATKTPFGLALVLALYKIRGQIKFSVREQRWKRLRENLQKLERQEKTGKAAPWVRHLFGSITALKTFIEFGHADILCVNTAFPSNGAENVGRAKDEPFN